MWRAKGGSASRSRAGGRSFVAKRNRNSNRGKGKQRRQERRTRYSRVELLVGFKVGARDPETPGEQD